MAATQEAAQCAHHAVALVQGRSTISLPLRVSRNEPARQVQLEVLHRFEYDAKMLMSGVIAKSNSSKTERAQVLIKGAPHQVCQLAEPDTVPQDWTQVRSFLLRTNLCHLAIFAANIKSQSPPTVQDISLPVKNAAPFCWHGVDASPPKYIAEPYL